LFCQSRYSALGEDQSTRLDRRELFVVAAVCFVAKHDSVFARDFLERVAGVPPADLDHDFDFKPQKAFCADLLVTDAVTGDSYVVEFKVGASLMQKQRADDPCFDERGGYGEQIRTLFPRTKTYTVLAQQTEFVDATTDHLCRRSRTWKELIPIGRSESPLETDLLNSLGEIGIPVLRLRHAGRMKNAPHAAAAIRIHELLSIVVADGFRIRPLDVGSDDSYEWVGMFLWPPPRKHAALREWLGPSGDYIGWIGYLMPKPDRPTRLSVWLIFDPQNATRRSETIASLKSVLGGCLIEAAPTTDEVVISTDAADVASEQEWFSATLSTVLTNTVPSQRRRSNRRNRR
jgi:hypothetical protein